MKINKGSMKKLAAITVATGFDVRTALDISSAASIAHGISKDCGALELWLDLQCYFRYDLATTVVKITAVTDNAGAAVFGAVAHGLSDGNIVVMRGFNDDAYNVQGTVANKTADTFEIGASYTAGMTPEDIARGCEAGLITDTISTGNDLKWPLETNIQRVNPSALEVNDDSFIVLHLRATSSDTTKYARIVEL